MVRKSTLFMGLASAMAALAIPHNKVKGFPDDASDLLHKWQPYLKVSVGCVPWPVVNAAGEIGEGLKDTGPFNGECGGNDGQIYAREKEWSDKYAIMYAWYFPKDHGDSIHGQYGHRHNWENVIIWLSQKSKDAALLGVSWTVAGGYETALVGDDGLVPGLHVQNDRPAFEYHNRQNWEFVLDLTDREGGEQPLIEWERMPNAAIEALSDYDFGEIEVPMKDGKLKENLSKAWAS